MTDQERARKLCSLWGDTPHGPACAACDPILEALGQVRAEERERKTLTEFSAERNLLAFAEQIESLAFKMPAPNEFTPVFVMLAQQMKASAHKRLAFNAAALRAGGEE